MKTIKFYLPLLSVSLSLLLVSCAQPKSDSDSDSQSVQTVSEPEFVQSNTSAAFNFSFSDQSQKFEVTNAKSKKINLPSGTQLTIPANCFVDASGEYINGKVDLVFEEFLTPGSIIASQINMKYDSAGKISDFESAGMFRISAFQNNKEVFIAKDKSIDVALATTDTDKNFNSYYSTQNGDDWQYLNRSTAIVNTNRATTRQQVSYLRNGVPPIKPEAYSANGNYFDLNLSEAYMHNLKSLLGVVWEYAGADKELDPAFNKVNFNRVWDHVSILPIQGANRGVYDIKLQNEDTIIRTTARPVYRGAVLDAANEEFTRELGEFNNRMQQASNQEVQWSNEAEFLRVVQVKQLGLYNYDRQYHAPDMVPVFANFNFGNDSLSKYPITVFLVTGNGMAVIQYPPGVWDKFMYSRIEDNKLIAILPNQEICTFSNTQFKKEGPIFPENSPGNFTFKLKPTGLKATSASDIDKALSAI